MVIENVKLARPPYDWSGVRGVGIPSHHGVLNHLFLLACND